ncbi:hypothetical protein RIF29_16857 [Crotalaria pallida]|uniref:Reverse transcriptase zinc-binding domain-containing protein n=1 Tax=Crotalaria pallida TaxID=3830 RepID=A0AAN9FHA0_CROPI
MDGVYTTKSRYRWLMGLEENNELIKQWSWLWNLQVPQHIVVFLWLVCRSALPTNSMRCQRRTIESDICSHCNVLTETTLHCLRDCPKAACVWEVFGIIVTMSSGCRSTRMNRCIMESRNTLFSLLRPCGGFGRLDVANVERDMVGYYVMRTEIGYAAATLVYATVIARIMSLLKRDWLISFKHILREGNRCADFLAKMGANMQTGFTHLDAPPHGLSTLLLDDAMGVSFARI